MAPTQGQPLYVSSDGHTKPQSWNPQQPTAMLPGAFNPVHVGHWRLAEVAAELLGLPVDFEISIINVDKPPLDPAEIEQRCAQFHGRAGLWLSNAPRFVDKAELFPGATFIVGVDTALRIVDPRYYDHDPARVTAALVRLRDLGSRLLVACRVEQSGRCLTVTDVPVPLPYRELFTAIPADRFRVDVSSSAIRKGKGS